MHDLHDTDDSWVFIPLNHDDALRIHLWIKRWPTEKEADEALARECESAISSAFEKLNIKYAFGDVRMETLRLYLGTNGIVMSKACFTELPSNIIRLKDPSRAIQY